MKMDVLANDCWIVAQLSGIRMLEHELTYALMTPGARVGETLQLPIARCLVRPCCGYLDRCSHSFSESRHAFTGGSSSPLATPVN